MTSGGNILPSETRTKILGASNRLWKDIWVENIESTLYKLYNTGNSAVIGVTGELTCRNKGNINTWMPMSASAFNTPSSKRYKENIQPITEERANKLDNIQIVTFDYKNKNNGVDVAGVIAEDVYKYIPEAVTLKTVDGIEVPDSVDYNKFNPYIIKKLQMIEKRLSKVEEKLV